MSGTVFISHSTADKDLVTYVARLVQSQGLRAYLAEHDPQPGSPVADKVIHNIKASDAVIVLLTKCSIDSRYVQQEIGAARMAKKLVVPLVDPKVASLTLTERNSSSSKHIDQVNKDRSTSHCVHTYCS